jgi:hypothetical protein
MSVSREEELIQCVVYNLPYSSYLCVRVAAEASYSSSLRPHTLVAEDFIHQ